MAETVENKHFSNLIIINVSSIPKKGERSEIDHIFSADGWSDWNVRDWGYFYQKLDTRLYIKNTNIHFSKIAKYQILHHWSNEGQTLNTLKILRFDDIDKKDERFQGSKMAKLGISVNRWEIWFYLLCGHGKNWQARNPLKYKAYPDRTSCRFWVLWLPVLPLPVL